MSTKNLSELNSSALPDAGSMRFALVVSEWNSEITESLFNAALDTLRKAGCPTENIFRHDVPGSFELPLGAKWALDAHTPDAVICIGCVIRGETSHFQFICDSVSHGIMQLQISYGIPVTFGVLTTENLQQAKDRSGGKHGNKGVEAAATAIQMVALKKKI